jgi:hypothetical protein
MIPGIWGIPAVETEAYYDLSPYEAPSFSPQRAPGTWVSPLLPSLPKMSRDKDQQVYETLWPKGKLLVNASWWVNTGSSSQITAGGIPEGSKLKG